MRRLAELFFKISFQNRTRHTGIRVAIFSLLAFTLFTFSTFAHAQTILSSDFEDGQLDGWSANGSPATLAVSTDMAHSGTQSLKVAGRSNTWDGPGRSMLATISPGDAWEFSVWVRLAPGQTADNFALQMHDPKDSSGWGGYPLATYKMQVTDSAWVQLKGRYPGTGGLNAGGDSLNLYVTSDSAATNYYIDDFVAWKQQPSGCYSSIDTTGDTSTFETDINWTARPYSNVTVSLTQADKHSGAQSLLQTGRTEQYNTAGYLATGKLCNGSTYKISAWVKLAPDATTPIDMNIGAKSTKDGTDTYLTLTGTKTVDNATWVQLSATYDMKTDYDVLWLYVQPTSDKTSSFYIDDFSIQYVPPATTIENIPSIAAQYQTYFPIGAAVYSPDVTSGDVHASLLTRHFSSVTPENDMKWSVTEPTENQFDFTAAEAIVDFATTNNIKVHGHTLVWGQQTPDWVFKDTSGVDMSTQPYSDANRDLLWSRMKNHIQTVITHFGAKVTSWDVVNEPFDESQTDGFKRNKWYIISGGPGYIDQAFKDAKEAVDSLSLPAGTIKLYINEYNTTVPAKLNFITSYLTAAKTASIPVDGVGHQLHNKLDWPVNDDPTSINSVTQAINAVANLGFDNKITEMDISVYPIAAATTYSSYADIVANLQNNLIIQGYRYRDYFSAFKSLKDKISSVTLWGEADDHTWLTTVSKTDAPLPFDKDLVHKYAYTGIMDATSLPNALPVAVDGKATVSFNTPTVITMVASDANLDTLAYTATAPAHGSLSAATGNKVTYTPTTGYFGTDSFTFTVNDGKGDSNVATVTITVLPAAPVAADQTVSVDINTPQNITLSATGDGTITYTVLTQPAHGTLTGTAPNLTYTPATGYTGADSFTFKANNSVDSNTATVTLNVVLLPPVAAAQSVTVDFNTAKDITLVATGQGTLTYSIVAQPAHGTLSGTAPAVKYTPAKDYFGPDSFTFKANNGNDSNTAKVTITVLPAVPVALDQEIEVDYNRPTLITLTSTGQGNITYSIVKMPKKAGTLVPSPAGQTVTWLYTNDNSLSEYLTQSTDEKLDSITFKANNGHESNVATVSITLKVGSLKVTPLAGQATSASIKAGDSASFNLQVNGFLNFATKSHSPVSLICGNVPNWASCSVSPTQVSLDDNMTPVPFKVTLTTNSSSAAAGFTSMPGSQPRIPWVPLCAFASFVLIYFTMSRAKMQWRMVGASAALLVVMTFTGCGGKTQTRNNNMVGTPTGTYTVTVSAVATRTINSAPASDWKIYGDIPLTITVN